jgi:hypothetical protein
MEGFVTFFDHIAFGVVTAVAYEFFARSERQAALRR